MPGPAGPTFNKISTAADNTPAVDFEKMEKEIQHKFALKNRAMDPRGSISVYPRLDLDFGKKKSLNFDMMKTEIFIKRGWSVQAEAARWFAYLLIGFFTGLTAFLMSLLEEFLMDKRLQLAEKILEKTDDNQLYAYLMMAGWCIFFCMFGSILTIKCGPGANGSGIAEIMAYLNGVNYPKFIGWDTLIIKCFCVIFGISGGLCIGKEGPLAHIGACIAVIVIYYIPIPQFDYFKNDVNKREFVCAGVSSGVSAAFGAPIGGTLFSYELSKPSAFWTFSMLWRTFFCSSMATFTLSMLTQIHSTGWAELSVNSAGTLKFGKLQDISVPLGHIWGAFVLGILGGVLGSLFITVNTYMSFFRKKYSTTTLKRVLECGLFGFMTITTMTLLVIYTGECQDIPNYKESDVNPEEVLNYNKWTCKDNQYNPLATLFLNTEAVTIKSLFHSSKYYTIEQKHLFAVMTTWYIFTITTYGVWIPAGLFLPGIIMGGSMGRFYTVAIQEWKGYVDLDELEQNTVLGAAAMLSGYCRLTYSLTVMMLETI